MKTAVFQINDSNGMARLVCVPMSTLQSACSLESWLQAQAGPGKDIKLLGRFEAVHMAGNQGEAEALILGGEGERRQTGTMLTIDEIVEKILQRASRS